ncbi:YusW family protein [Sporosarcina luteola]|uniref:YusW family protein n=1 Tax=Sporosarcina luteola TaxID=582850 RepID=UPI00203D786C|nr:YusW family protein [Sporosarcina luteola]MCM3744269.1 YusW family protein [Sporosarcina luteola]
MRNNVKVIMLFLAAVLVLGACGNASKNADNPKREDATLIYENEKEGGTMNTGDGYGFNKFDLEIEVEGKEVIDVEYEVAKNHRAKYVNKLAGLNLKDQEAFNKLDPLFVKFASKKSLSEQDIKQNIMEWFGLDTYTKFDLEIDFDDGTKMDIEDRK